jgi:hypothetical protein
MATLRPGSILDPDLECLSPEAWRTRLSERLVATVAHAWKGAPRARRALEQAGLSPADVRGLEDLARLPITRKDSLPALQAEEPPFGGLAAVDPGALARLFMSPSTIRRGRTATSGASATAWPPPASGAATWCSTPPATT